MVFPINIDAIFLSGLVIFSRLTGSSKEPFSMLLVKDGRSLSTNLVFTFVVVTPPFFHYILYQYKNNYV